MPYLNQVQTANRRISLKSSGLTLDNFAPGSLLGSY